MGKIYVPGSCKTAICGSKLFISSSRKDKIKAALDNPINAELVKQLDEYIGDEYKQEPKSEEPKPIDNKSDDANDKGVPSDKPIVNGPSNSPKSLSEKFGDALDAEDSAAFDETHPEESDDTDTPDDTNSAQKIKQPYVKAASTFEIPFVENCVSLSNLAGELKGTLNARADTAGVIRVAIKNIGTGEVWIHYNDDINLNNVMSTVIELLNAANYQYLIFNRLARTENAIVFTISANDTMNNMESVKNEK